MKDDLGKYIQRRKRTDKAFAKSFESGLAKFKKALGGRTVNPVGTRSRAKPIAWFGARS